MTDVTSEPIEVGPWAAKRFELLKGAGPGNPPSDEITTPTEPVAGATPPGPTPERIDALPPDVRDKMDAFAASVDSTALVALHDGVLVHEWYADGTDRGTLRPSQSMHKSVLGLVVLRAIDEGLLPGLDVPAATWLTEWADDGRAAITIDHLLRMESGLAQHGMSMDPSSPAFHWLFGDDTTSVVLGFPAAGPPGKRFEYNNLNSQALGILLGRATGEPYAQLLNRLLWEPIGAAAASVWIDRPGGQAATSCCLNARAYDWALVGELIRNRGTVAGRDVMSGAIVDSLTDPSPRDPVYARQIWLGDAMDIAGEPVGGLSPVGRFTAAEPFAEQGVIAANGFGGQRVYIGRASKVVVVRMGPPVGSPRFEQRWDNTKLFNAVARNLA